MSTPQPDERILIVDDEEQIRTLLARLLGAHGYECLTAELGGGRAAPAQGDALRARAQRRQHARRVRIDFTREVLAHFPDTAVVMVTGIDDRGYADAAIESVRTATC